MCILYVGNSQCRVSGLSLAPLSATLISWLVQITYPVFFFRAGGLWLELDREACCLCDNKLRCLKGNVGTSWGLWQEKEDMEVTQVNTRTVAHTFTAVTNTCTHTHSGQDSVQHSGRDSWGVKLLHPLEPLWILFEPAGHVRTFERLEEQIWPTWPCMLLISTWHSQKRTGHPSEPGSSLGFFLGTCLSR